MKKVKIMLTAITVFAIVGGALAFKAKRFGCILYTTNQPSAGATCPIRELNFCATIVQDPNYPNKISVTTQLGGTPCVLSWTKIGL